MAQFARPSADTLRDNWVTQADGTTNLYATLDESVADDADYIKTQLTPTSDVYVTKLTTVEDPISATGHIVRYRYRKDVAAGDQIDLTVELRQDYVNEGDQGTLIHQEVHTNLDGSGWTDGTFTLSAGEANAITDYASLFLRFLANKP